MKKIKISIKFQKNYLVIYWIKESKMTYRDNGPIRIKSQKSKMKFTQQNHCIQLSQQPKQKRSFKIKIISKSNNWSFITLKAWIQLKKLKRRYLKSKKVMLNTTILMNLKKAIKQLGQLALIMIHFHTIISKILLGQKFKKSLESKISNQAFLKKTKSK